MTMIINMIAKIKTTLRIYYIYDRSDLRMTDNYWSDHFKKPK